MIYTRRFTFLFRLTVRWISKDHDLADDNTGDFRSRVTPHFDITTGSGTLHGNRPPRIDRSVLRVLGTWRVIATPRYEMQGEITHPGVVC